MVYSLVRWLQRKRSVSVGFLVITTTDFTAGRKLFHSSCQSTYGRSDVQKNQCHKHYQIIHDHSIRKHLDYRDRSTGMASSRTRPTMLTRLPSSHNAPLHKTTRFYTPSLPWTRRVLTGIIVTIPSSWEVSLEPCKCSRWLNCGTVWWSERTLGNLWSSRPFDMYVWHRWRLVGIDWD